MAAVTARTLLLLALAAALCQRGLAQPPARPEFVPGSAFASAVKEQATGIYVLGTTRIRSWSAVHYVLVRDGRGLQIQTKAGGAWLPKLDGSGGGHTVGLERFEQLLSLAGGVNRDVKQLPAQHRDRFFCLAGFGGCVARVAPVPVDWTASLGARRPVAADLVMPAAGPLAGALLTVSPMPAGRGIPFYVAQGGPGQEFRFAFETSTRRLWFAGWGIHAGWLVPPLDEI